MTKLEGKFDLTTFWSVVQHLSHSKSFQDAIRFYYFNVVIVRDGKCLDTRHYDIVQHEGHPGVMDFSEGLRISGKLINICNRSACNSDTVTYMYSLLSDTGCFTF